MGSTDFCTFFVITIGKREREAVAVSLPVATAPGELRNPQACFSLIIRKANGEPTFLPAHGRTASSFSTIALSVIRQSEFLL